ncbi:entericidin A/B family lipoprotein [Orbus sturtevantii]
MQKIILVFIMSLVFLSGCNTVSGAGEDIQASGKAITTAADDVKSKL